MRLFSDTDEATERVLLDGYRKMSPARKIARVSDLNTTLRNLAIEAERLHHPNAPERELRLRVAARVYDRATMIAAFGWDPAGSNG